MTLRKTTWQPDTCTCILEYQWDDAVPIDQRVTVPFNTINRCADHSSLSDNASHFDTVLEENTRKNGSLREIIANAPATLLETQPNGSITFRKDINVSWNLTGTVPDRIITVTITGITLTTNQKNAVQTKLNQKFGINKIVFVN